MNTWIPFWNILKKDMKNYYLKPPNISWGIIFPLAWTLMFFLRTETPLDVKEILPGLIGLSILFGTTSMLAVTITFEKKSRSFERLLLSPISIYLLMLAKTTGAILFGVFNAFIPLLLASLLTNLSGISLLPILGSVVLIAITSTFLGLMIAVSVSEVFEAQTFSNFFRFPMIFLCGLFIPLEQLPLPLRPLSHLLPLTYGVDILKNAINGSGSMLMSLNFLLLFLFSGVLFGVSIRNINKKWIL